MALNIYKETDIFVGGWLIDFGSSQPLVRSSPSRVMDVPHRKTGFQPDAADCRIDLPINTTQHLTPGRLIS